MLMFAIAGWIAMAAALCGVCYAVASIRATRRVFKSDNEVVARFPPVTVLKPLHLAEIDLAETLASFCAQDYPSAMQLVFGVESPDDSAIPVVRALQAAHP